MIEAAAGVRNQLLRKSGYSPSQWFLGQDSKTAGWLLDVEAQEDSAVQSQIVNDPSYAAKMHLREEAARACLEEHAKDVWRRAIAARNTPIRGPYYPGQLVYFFRRRGRAQLSTRHGVWMGPARVVGVESSKGHVIPRAVWVSYNGFLNRCSPEGLRPIPEEEQEFKRLARELSVGQLPADLEETAQTLRNGQYQDCIGELPGDEDLELNSDIEDEPEVDVESLRRKRGHDGDPGPRPVRRRITRSPDYWNKRALGAGPLGRVQEDPVPTIIRDLEHPHAKRVRIADHAEVDSPQQQAHEDQEMYSPSYEEEQEEPRRAGNMQPNASEVETAADLGEPVPEREGGDHSEPSSVGAADGHHVPVPPAGEDELFLDSLGSASEVLEVSFDIWRTDITSNPLCLWSVVDERMPECSVTARKETKSRSQFPEPKP